MPDSHNDDFLNVRQVAEITGLSEKTIRSWINKGKLRAIQPGGKNWLIRRSDIVAPNAQPSEPPASETERPPGRTFANTAGRVVIRD